MMPWTGVVGALTLVACGQVESGADSAFDAPIDGFCTIKIADDAAPLLCPNDGKTMCTTYECNWCRCDDSRVGSFCTRFACGPSDGGGGP